MHSSRGWQPWIVGSFCQPQRCECACTPPVAGNLGLLARSASRGDVSAHALLPQLAILDCGLILPATVMRVRMHSSHGWQPFARPASRDDVSAHALRSCFFSFAVLTLNRNW